MFLKEVLKKNKKCVNVFIKACKYKNKTNNIKKTLIYAVKIAIFYYFPNTKKSKGEQIKNLFGKLKVHVDDNSKFLYVLNEYKGLYAENKVIDNNTMDYNIILEKSLDEFELQNNQMSNSQYKDEQKRLLEAINLLIKKEIKAVEKSKNINKNNIIKNLKNIKNGKTKSFEEALQRILFYNQLLWQTGHELNGLGRLDKILCKYYESDIKNNVITKDEAKNLIKEFLTTLHNNYVFKSSSLLGDTGQIIILGGKEPNEEYFENELTYIFIEEVKKLQIPEPKILLRISEKTSRKLMKVSLDCIKTGIGCPLFSNDDIVIPKLIEYGYEIKDAYNYVTAACWEPYICGKSLDQNNLKTIVVIKPFVEMINTEDINKINNINELMSLYKKYLYKYLDEFLDEINKISFEKDPLISMLNYECNEKEKDISKGGAKYNNYGFTSVSLANTVNSILNINKFVFEEKKYSFEELNEERKNNFNDEKILNELKFQSLRYGKDEKEVIQLTNLIINWIGEYLKDKNNKYDGKYKFGLSAPSYIDESREFEATFDGRRIGEPFIVHISSDITSNPYTELIQFASKLDYNKASFNGNVIDFMVTPSFIESNKEKFLDFLILSTKVGFFQMQMNVVSSEILIKAKKNPKEFPNLIVRVWGFSAYFNDLPEEYKNLLIERALKSEGIDY